MSSLEQELISACRVSYTEEISVCMEHFAYMCGVFLAVR